MRGSIMKMSAVRSVTATLSPGPHEAAKGDVGAVPYAGLRKRLEGQNHFFA